MNKLCTQKTAFSLVELSIVLVILGLLVGGVLSGQSLIRAAELRAVSTEYSRYAAAVQTFRDKYIALPGDMANATAFWGTQAGCSGNCITAPTGTLTFNGNGDGQISCPGPCSTATTGNETYRAWQHMANAGLIEGNYSGVPSIAPLFPEWGWATDFSRNSPRSRFSNSGWSLYWYGTTAIADVSNFEGEYQNALFFGGADSGGLAWLNTLTPEEAWNIDTKSDDGRPATGAVVSFEIAGGVANPCSDLPASATLSRAASVYSLQATGKNCALAFRRVAG